MNSGDPWFFSVSTDELKAVHFRRPQILRPPCIVPTCDPFLEALQCAYLRSLSELALPDERGHGPAVAPRAGVAVRGAGEEGGERGGGRKRLRRGQDKRTKQ